jgi:hypothetical protein
MPKVKALLDRHDATHYRAAAMLQTMAQEATKAFYPDMTKGSISLR